MTIKSIWHCDGCDEEQDGSNKAPSDWKRVTITADGFDGYPTCGVGNTEERGARYELCPACAKRFSDRINPRRWARVAQQEVQP